MGPEICPFFAAAKTDERTWIRLDDQIESKPAFLPDYPSHKIEK
jgi:hypothetical protein